MTATPAAGQTPEPKTVPEYLQKQQLEWGVYVASGVIDINGQFLLEINSNPSLLNVDDEKASADYMMEYDQGGSEGFLVRIFRSAIVRREKRMLPPQLTRRRKLVPVEVQR